MKKITIITAILFCNLYSFAQSAKTKEIIEQLKNKNSKAAISFSGLGVNVTQKATLIKTAKGQFALGSDLVTALGEKSNIQILAKLISGKQEMVRKDGSIATINGTPYEISGTINFVVTGKIVSGTFTGVLYKVESKKAKANLVPAGKITGSFSNLNIPK